MQQYPRSLHRIPRAGRAGCEPTVAEDPAAELPITQAASTANEALGNSVSNTAQEDPRNRKWIYTIEQSKIQYM